MKEFINDLIDIGIGSSIDMSNHKVVIEDVVHRVEMTRAYELQEKLMDSLTEEQQEMFEEYIDAVSAANTRVCNLTYLLGVKKMMELSEEPIQQKI